MRAGRGWFPSSGLRGQHQRDAAPAGPSVWDSAEPAGTGDSRILDLALPAFAAQLGERFDQRHEPADRAPGLAARQLPAVGRKREVAVEAQVMLRDKTATVALGA